MQFQDVTPGLGEGGGIHFSSFSDISDETINREK